MVAYDGASYERKTSNRVISFHFLPARLYVRVDETAGGSQVSLAAITVKGFEIFEEQFADLVEALKRGLGLGPHSEPENAVT